MSDAAPETLAARVDAHMRAIVGAGPHRDVASAGNRAANDYFERVAREAGFEVERLGFDCVTWVGGEDSAEPTARLRAGGREDFEVFPGPYSLPFAGEAPLVAASTIEELEALGDLVGRIVLLHGDIVSEQLTPKEYPFYKMERHTRILGAIEASGAAAVIAATTKNPGLVGAIYPFPLIEDAAVAFPSAFMRETEGARLIGHAGDPVELRIDSGRVPDRGEQVVARLRGATEGAGRVLVMGHIDTRRTTPGALDNAAGAACLLALAEELAVARARGAEPPRHTIEVLPFNGEDNYAAPGEMAYLAANPDGFEDVALAINLDALGYVDGPTEVSSYTCTEVVREAVERGLANLTRTVEGPQWPMSDHMVFVMRGVPAIAITSRAIHFLEQEICHTAKDVPELVDAELLAETVTFLVRLISEL